MKKRIYVLLAVFCFVLAFTACSKDDDDNGPAFAPDGKRLVSKMVYEVNKPGDEDESRKEEFTFSYNGEGKMTRIEGYVDYLDGYWEKEVCDISWKDKEIQMTFTESAEDEPAEKSSYTGKLNAEGYVVSGVYDYGEESSSYSYTYNSNGNLISEKKGESSPKIFTWQNGNCVVIGSHSSQNTCTFGTDENKANIDFVLFLRTCDLEFLTGRFGKGSRMLPTMVEQSFYDYVLDDEGYVTAVKSRNGKATVTVTYN